MGMAYMIIQDNHLLIIVNYNEQERGHEQLCIIVIIMSLAKCYWPYLNTQM